ncbi:RNA polymerase sigma factor [Bryobacter aggregatus]|uniref:RNA polymerase sigma factor n=1 Tax=Bryobacter aggregatus TaxID=360054 RepID=UPI001EE296F4|nr:sigma-70 family RNA polymerase sigma factor [Bryobacter aggregatus]
MSQNDLYERATADYGAALDRLARAYEADPERRRDLLQEIHLQLWRSLGSFDGRCSLRTWIYRVAHHTATSHMIRERKLRLSLISIEDLDVIADPDPQKLSAQQQLEMLSAMIRRLKAMDRQIIVCYLEGLDAASTGEITGLSPGNIAMKIHRIKNILARRFRTGGSHES